MPKKKTGQRKKHEKQRARQKEIRKKGKTHNNFQGQGHLSRHLVTTILVLAMF